MRAFFVLFFICASSVFTERSLSTELQGKALEAYEQFQKDAKELSDSLDKDQLCQRDPSSENCLNTTQTAVLNFARKSLAQILTFRSYGDVLKTKELFTQSGWDNYIIALSRAGIINPEQKQVISPSSLDEGDIEFAQDYYSSESPQGYSWTIILKIKDESPSRYNKLYVSLKITTSFYLKSAKVLAEHPVPTEFKVEQVIVSMQDPRSKAR